jgi:hypothetical protein
MAIVGSMHWLLEGDHLTNLLNVVLVIATGVVVWFAWRTVTEAKRATNEERKTVTELKKLVPAAQATAEQQKAAAGHLDQLAATAKDTAASSANAVEAAKQTVELAIEAAKAADQRAAAAAERDRKSALRALAFGEIEDFERRRDRVERIGQLIEDLFWRIEQSEQALEKAAWMPLRNSLRHQLIGLAADLPNCARIVDAGTATQAFGLCVNARTDIEQALARFGSAIESSRGVLLQTIQS